jgi:demethylmenaquinone methyltransferase/2-methoxy-6-polyprenyl-1,4-benzoquinol methylase
MPASAPSPSREEVHRMFDRIAHRYDLLNRILSGGNDILWRRKVRQSLPDGDNLDILDLATGTADILVSLHRSGRVGHGVGLDMSDQMLKLGKRKICRGNLEQKISLVRSDATSIPFASSSFDAVTISFGIRNVTDVDVCLKEMHRVLRPGGVALILEFSLPKSSIMRGLHMFYLRHFVPRIGTLLSGDNYAYSYLDKTIETFPYGAAFGQLMESAGFDKVSFLPLTFGVATLYRGIRKEH